VVGGGRSCCCCCCCCCCCGGRVFPLVAAVALAASSLGSFSPLALAPSAAGPRRGAALGAASRWRRGHLASLSSGRREKLFCFVLFCPRGKKRKKSGVAEANGVREEEEDEWTERRERGRERERERERETSPWRGPHRRRQGKEEKGKKWRFSPCSYSLCFLLCVFKLVPGYNCQNGLRIGHGIARNQSRKTEVDAGRKNSQQQPVDGRRARGKKSTGEKEQEKKTSSQCSLRKSQRQRKLPKPPCRSHLPLAPILPGQ
jgi:hypothetical protein